MQLHDQARFKQLRLLCGYFLQIRPIWIRYKTHYKYYQCKNVLMSSALRGRAQTYILTELHCAPPSCLSLVNARGRLMNHLICTKLPKCEPPKCPCVQSYIMVHNLCFGGAQCSSVVHKVTLYHCGGTQCSSTKPRSSPQQTNRQTNTVSSCYGQ